MRQDSWLAPGGGEAAPVPGPPPAVPARGRIGWLDAAKGIGIILVVIGHASGGLIDAHWGGQAPALRALFVAIYTFHMPLFFLLSGLLVAERLERDSRRFVRGLGMSIVWPYFLWSTIQFTTIYLMSAFVNQPIEQYWPVLAALPIRPVSQFWFLFALFFMHLLSFATLRALGGTAFLLLALAAKPLTLLVTMPPALFLVAAHLPFYGLGVFLGAAGARALVIERPAAARAAMLPLAALLVWLALAAAPRLSPTVDVATDTAAALARVAWNGPNFPAALAGTLAALALASFARGWIAAVLAYLGERTMPIFILHILVIAGLRIVLGRIVPGVDAIAMMAFTAAIGLALPLVAFAILRRLGLSYALGLGR